MSNDFTYGGASEVAERLLGSPNIYVDDLHASMINALNRISRLEHEVGELRKATFHAANVATCLANGIKPD
jgi:hypothetical protein